MSLFVALNIRVSVGGRRLIKEVGDYEDDEKKINGHDTDTVEAGYRDGEARIAYPLMIHGRRMSLPKKVR